MSVLSSIKRDIDAIRERDPAARSALEVVFAYPGFHAREVHRLSHTLTHRVLEREQASESESILGFDLEPFRVRQLASCTGDHLVPFRCVRASLGEP